MLTPAEIAEYGERHVESYLVAQGYRCRCSRPHHGASDIEARGEDSNLYVHVMTTRGDHLFPDLTTSDRGRVVTHAMSLDCDAWLAQVRIGPNGELAGDVGWQQLNH
jgi:hypothetical protein